MAMRFRCLLPVITVFTLVGCMPATSERVIDSQLGSSEAIVEEAARPTFVDETTTLADGPEGTVMIEKKGLTSKISITRDGQTFVMDSETVDEEYGYWRYDYRDVRFSPSGRYVIFDRIGWEWRETIVYDIDQRRAVRTIPSAQTTATTQAEHALYSCGVDEMGGERHAKVYSLPAGDELVSVFPEAGSGNMLITVECGMKNENVEFTFSEWPTNVVMKTIVVDPTNGRIISR